VFAQRNAACLKFGDVRRLFKEPLDQAADSSRDGTRTLDFWSTHPAHAARGYPSWTRGWPKARLRILTRALHQRTQKPPLVGADCFV